MKPSMFIIPLTRLNNEKKRRKTTQKKTQKKTCSENCKTKGTM